MLWSNCGMHAGMHVSLRPGGVHVLPRVCPSLPYAHISRVCDGLKTKETKTSCTAVVKELSMPAGRAYARVSTRQQRAVACRSEGHTMGTGLRMRLIKCDFQCSERISVLFVECLELGRS